LVIPLLRSHGLAGAWPGPLITEGFTPHRLTFPVALPAFTGNRHAQQRVGEWAAAGRRNGSAVLPREIIRRPTPGARAVATTHPAAKGVESR